MELRIEEALAEEVFFHVVGAGARQLGFLLFAQCFVGGEVRNEAVADCGERVFAVSAEVGG